MKIRVLRTAMDDLAAGRLFYDKQLEGVPTGRHVVRRLSCLRSIGLF